MSEKKSRASTEKKKPSSSGKKRSSGSSIVSTLLLVAVTGGLLSFLILKNGPLESLTGPVHPVKAKYPTFEDFFPFYLAEHANGISRLLHVLGTTVVILLALLRDPRAALSLVAAVSAGLLVRELTIGLAHGFVEFGAMLATFLLLNKLFLGGWFLELLVVPYTLAWVGHFFFEHNTPATFLYPAYSLLGDFRMFFGVLTTAIPIKF
jgi:hypothetical protein